MDTCLTNVIRLSRTECPCFDSGKPVDYNEGQAEVYLDELEGLNLTTLQGAENCEEGDIWDLMAWSRTESEAILKADLLSCINLNYVSRKPIYTGLIGQTKFTSTLSLTESKAGSVVSFPQTKSGSMTVKRIGLAINATATVTVEVYDNDENQTTPIASYAINTTANTLTYAILGTPLVLPLFSNNVDKLEYYFVYDRVGFQPKDNKNDCGCGGIVPGWKPWVSYKGIKGNTTDYESMSTTKEINGILLDVDFRCKTADIVCSDTRPLDFENSGWDMELAYANRYKAGELLLQKMLDSPDLNRFTMMNREKTYGMRNHAAKMYKDFIAYLCETVENEPGGCLVCKPNPNFSTGPILS